LKLLTNLSGSSNIFSGAKTIEGTVIISAVMYCSAVWTLSESNENSLEVWERKILRRIHGPVKENAVWRICTDTEFMDLCSEPYDISEIRKEDYNG
jgi:hypothetical protein